MNDQLAVILIYTCATLLGIAGFRMALAGLVLCLNAAQQPIWKIRKVLLLGGLSGLFIGALLLAPIAACFYWEVGK